MPTDIEPRKCGKCQAEHYRRHHWCAACANKKRRDIAKQRHFNMTLDAEFGDSSEWLRRKLV